MKAAIINAHGDLDRLEIADVPKPKPAAGEVLIQVKSAALNHLDIWVRMGSKETVVPMPHTLGSDASGIIADLGPDVTDFEKADRVIINPALSCGRCDACRRGQQSECADFGLIGLSRPGTFAEYVTVPAACVYPKPEHLSFVEAAALPLSYVTAWRMLMTRAKLKPGELVLIHGIGGGVALAALQLAKLASAEVIATSSSDAKLSRAKDLGADHTINYRQADVVQTVKDLTSGRGVDIALDTVGAATWSANFATIRRGGRIVICGVTTGPKAETNLQALYWKQLTVLGSTMGSDEDFRRMLAAVAAARLKPVIDCVEPLENIRKAQQKMEKAEQFGKIVLNVSD
jgi:NADPH:quinone reductase-like Zn-dependent oxidoreductase